MKLFSCVLALLLLSIAFSVMVAAEHCAGKNNADCSAAGVEYHCKGTQPNLHQEGHTCSWKIFGKDNCYDNDVTLIGVKDCGLNEQCDAASGCHYVYCEAPSGKKEDCNSLPEIKKDGKCYGWYCNWELFSTDFCDLKEKKCPVTTALPADESTEFPIGEPTVTDLPVAETTAEEAPVVTEVPAADAFGAGETGAMAGRSPDYQDGYADGYAAGSGGSAGDRVGAAPSKPSLNVPSLSSSAIVGLLLVVLLVIAGFASMRSAKK